MLQLSQFFSGAGEGRMSCSGWNLTAVQSLNCFSNFTIFVFIFPPPGLYSQLKNESPICPPRHQLASNLPSTENSDDEDIFLPISNVNIARKEFSLD